MRAVLLSLAVLAGVLSLSGFSAAGRAQPTSDELAQGGALYQRHCAKCHATDGSGAEDGAFAGPAVDDVDVAYVDLVLRTGRMPMVVPEMGLFTDRLEADDREAVVAWMATTFGLPGAVPEPDAGSAARGHPEYVRHCAACHGTDADGGVAGGNTYVPPIAGADPTVVFEAVRVGPFDMPAFAEEALDDQAVEDIAAYLGAVAEAPATPLGLRSMHQVTAALFAAVLLGAGVAVAWVVARDRRPAFAPPASTDRSEP